MASSAFSMVSRLMAAFLALVKQEMPAMSEQTDVLAGRNFPDPAIIRLDDTNYVFGTNDGSGHTVPLTINSDFEDPSGWSDPIEAFPASRSASFKTWARSDSLWAPAVSQLTDGDGSFVMYYAAGLRRNPAVHCLGVAKSSNVEGPYVDSSRRPLICPEDIGGAIDASAFVDDDGQRYIVYKIDGPAVNGGGYCASPDNTEFSTAIMLVRTAADGSTLQGAPVTIYDNQGVADKWNVEAPKIVKSADGTYFLFISSGCYGDDSYAESYVTSANITGPYGDRQDLLQTGSFDLFGPGGADITDSPPYSIVFHSLKTNDTVQDGRVLNTATIELENGSVTFV